MSQLHELSPGDLALLSELLAKTPHSDAGVDHLHFGLLTTTRSVKSIGWSRLVISVRTKSDTTLAL